MRQGANRALWCKEGQKPSRTLLLFLYKIEGVNSMIKQNKNIQISVKLTQNEYVFLKEQAEQEGRTMAGQMRYWLNLVKEGKLLCQK